MERDLPVLALLLARLLGLEEARKVVTPLFFPEDMYVPPNSASCAVPQAEPPSLRRVKGPIDRL